MVASVLGKRTREAALPTRVSRRLTRSFSDRENQDPTNATESSDQSEAEHSEVEEQEQEQVGVFSPHVTRTPSARRTKSIYKLEAVEYRE